MRLPILSVANSAPVSTATTPGILLASEASMPLMRARACGERTNTARASPGRTTSSVYWPLPVMKRMSSFRRTAAPIPVALMAVSSQLTVIPTSAGGSRAPPSPLSHGLRDVVVARAAAQIAVALLADRVLVEVIAITAHDVERGHGHARRAVAALEAVMLAESLLHRVQLAARLGQTLDRGDLGALALKRERGAGFCSDAVDMHDAGAALGRVAADMRAGQPEVLAQELHQQGARLDFAGDGFPVHRHGHGRHRIPPTLGPNRPLLAVRRSSAATGA